MSTHFWFGGEDEKYQVQHSTKFNEGQLTRTPADTDPHEFGKSGDIEVATIANATVPQSDKVFATTIYTGDGSNRTITNDLDLSGEGGMVWLKSRGAAYSHYIFDTERGPESFLSSESTGTQLTGTGRLTAFNSDGFDLGVETTVNQPSIDFVGWSFQRAPQFFDIVTYTGTGAVQEIPHNLGSTPGMIITKSVSGGASHWAVYHTERGATEYGLLNSTISFNVDPGYWNDTEPTDTEFTVGTSSVSNNSGLDYIAYVFGNEPGTIKCGVYAGTGSAGNTVNCGFRPQWVLVKNATSTGTWLLFDSTRGDKPDGDNYVLFPDTNGAESFGNYIDYTDTGFSVTGTSGSINSSGNNYIYVAIAEGGLLDTSFNEDQTTMEFSAPTGLETDLKTELFAVGDTVNQDSAFIATSSNVTTVETINQVPAPLSSTNTVTAITQTAAGAWTALTDPTGWLPLAGGNVGDYHYDSHYANGVYIASASQGIGRSTDGITWTRPSIGSNPYAKQISYGDGVWAVIISGQVSGNGKIYTSEDNGVTWTGRTINGGPIGHTSVGYAFTFSGLAYGDGRWVAIGSQSNTSSISQKKIGAFSITTADLIGSTNTSWDYTQIYANTNWGSTNCVKFGNGTFVAQLQTGGSTSVYATDMYSKDGGLTWSNISGQGWNHTNLWHGPFILDFSEQVGQFAICHGDGIYNSEDGVTWVKASVSRNASGIRWDPTTQTWLAFNQYTLDAFAPDLTSYTTLKSIPTNTGYIQFLAAGGPTRIFSVPSGSGSYGAEYSVGPVNRLTISGALTDGFVNYDLVDNGSGSAFDTIWNISDTQIDLTGLTVGWSVGDTVHRSPAGVGSVFAGNTKLTFASNQNFEYMLSGNSIVQDIIYNGNVGTVDSGANTITLSGVSEFYTGSPVSTAVTASGIIRSYDIPNNSMVVGGVTGLWIAGEGKHVVGSVRRLPKYQSETSGLIGATALDPDYKIEQSLAFDQTDSRLYHTPTSEWNRNTFTISFWAKAQGENANNDRILHVGNNSSGQFSVLMPQGSGAILVMAGSSGARMTTSIIVDHSRWMHVVIAMDSTQATDTDRMKLYVDGVQITEFSNIVYPTLNQSFDWGTTQEHNIGKYGSTINDYWDGHLADFQYVEGTAHDANAFGYFDAYGYWNAKDFTDPKALDTITTATDSQLTLASNNNFGELAVGKTITQDSGYTATTSNVTGISGGGSTSVDPESDWTHTYTSVSGGGVSDMYDGSLTDPNYFAPNYNNTNYVEITYGSGIPVTKLEVYMYSNYAQSYTKWTANGDTASELDGTAPAAVNGWTDITGCLNGGAGGTLNTLRLSQGPGPAATAMYIYGWRINGVVVTNPYNYITPAVLTLTDDTDLNNLRVGNEVTQSRGNTFTDTDYISDLTSDTGFQSGNEAASAAFDGDIVNTYAESLGQAGSVFTFEYGTTVYDSSVIVTADSYLGQTCTVDWYNGVTLVHTETASPASSGDVEVFLPVGTAITKVVMTRNGSAPMRLLGIKVNRQVLVQGEHNIDRSTATVLDVDTNATTITVDPANPFQTSYTVSAALAAGIGTVTAFNSTTNTIDYTLVDGLFIGGESKVANVLTNSYGTNGFQFKFALGNLGVDSAPGSSNDWNVTGFDVDATRVDSPTNYGTDTGLGGEVRGNYAVWSTLDSSPSLNIDNDGSGLKVSFAGSYGTYGTIRASMHLGDGKYYWETTAKSDRTYSYHGIMRVDQSLVDGASDAIGYLYPGSAAIYLANGRMTQDGVYSTPSNVTVTDGDIIGHAYDATTGKYWYSVNNVWAGDPAAGTSEDATLDTSYMWAPAISEGGTGTTTTNFGQTVFTYQAPAGFKTLNTHNL